jgi:hypothetical protein
MSVRLSSYNHWRSVKWNLIKYSRAFVRYLPTTDVIKTQHRHACSFMFRGATRDELAKSSFKRKFLNRLSGEVLKQVFFI